MTRRVIRQELRLCIGCYSCEIHCKTSKGLGEGPRLCRIYEHEEPWDGGVPKMSFGFMTCRHCDDPECVKICPTGAMRQRSEDGVVYVDHEACVGCRLCLHACPWGVPQYDPEQQVVLKCDLCRERLDRGLLPACVTKCVTGCLSFVEPGEPGDPIACLGEGGVEVSS